jgi:polar amino acid transport system substrate-binding protein
MRMRAFVMAVAAAVLVAACGSSGGTTASPGGSTAGNPCAKSNLTLVTPGQLTIGTDNPAFDPYFQGPTGHEWKGEFNHDPYNDQGFEDATAYAVAQQLGFSKDQVNWVAVPFNNSYKPGPKNFDFYLAQVSYSPQRAKGADLSDSYYDEQEAVVALQGTDISKATSVAALKPFTFGAQIGTTSYDVTNSTIAPDSAVQTFNTLNAALQALKNGQIDGLVVDFPTAYYMANIQLDNGTIVGILPSTAGKEHFSMVLEQGSSLTQCVNGALSALRADGTLAQIQDRWLNQAAHAPELQ